MPNSASSFCIPLARLAGVLSLTLFLACGAAAQDAVDRLGIPGPVKFDSKDYALAWSSQPSDTYIKQEYLPAGETLQDYSSMVLLEVLTAGAGVGDALSAQVGTLNDRRASDPLVNMSLMQNEQTGEAILNFIVSTRNDKGDYIVEWNAYRYAPRAAGGVTLFGISHRAYGEEKARAFLVALKDLRSEQINKIAQREIPKAKPAQ